MAGTPNEVPVEALPLKDEIRTPISEGNPCGEDVTYDDSFQALVAEIDKAGTVSGRVDHERMDEGGSVFTTSGTDYGRIVDGSRDILRTRSKDLRVASYLAIGLYQTRGIIGLSEGLAALYVLIETYWEDLYPPKRRARARRGAIDLLTGRVKEALASHKPTPSDQEPLEQALAEAARLQESVKDKLQGDDQPSMDGLIQALTECRRRMLRATAPETQSSSPAEKPESERRTAERGATPGGDSPREMKSPTDAERLVFEASKFLRAKDRANPVPYRLNRALRWGAVLQEPPHQDGKTQLPAPLQQRRDYLIGLHDKGDHSTLIDEAEASFQEPPFHFWLDLQRLVAASADALDASFRQVRGAVLEETGLLVRRLPGLLALAFSDGTPFADPLTLEWIEVRAKAASGAESPTGADLPDGSEHLEELYAAARERLSDGDLAGALTTMQDGREHDASQKDRFSRRLYLALLCLRGGQAAIARPVLESLDEEITKLSLEAWDPALALKVWSNLYTCYETLGRGINNPDKQTVREQASQIFEKICRLDTQYALTFVSKGKR